jgi:putative phosphonate metabolism protein
MTKNFTGRYAIYYAPEEGSPLHEFGTKWLGRDAITGQDVASYSVPGFGRERVQELTESPRQYGFHATLKPPFHLADGAQPDQLCAAVLSLASEISSFALESLELSWLGKFLALVPSKPSQQLSYLADECVRRLDRFGAPPSGEELAKHRFAGLTGNQEKLLERWGYPYVMEEFRFHLSLTCPIKDAMERDRIFPWADLLTRPSRRSPLEISSVCIFEQKNREAPFRLAQRFRLSGSNPEL